MAAGFLSGCGQPPVETSGTDPQRLQLLETEISQLRQQLDRARRQVDELEAELAGTPQAVVQESGRSTQEILDELKESEQTLGEILVLKELLSAKAWAEVKSQDNVIQLMLGEEEKKQRSSLAALAMAAVGSLIAIPAGKMGLA